MNDWIQRARDKEESGVTPPGFWLDQRLGAKVEGGWKGDRQGPTHVAAAQRIPPATSKANHWEASVISEDGGKSSKKQGKCLLPSPLAKTSFEDVSDGKTSSKCLMPGENLCLF